VHTGSNSTCRVTEKGMSMGKAKKYVALVAVMVILAMTVTACSGGTSSTTTGASKTATVKLAIGAPLTAGAVALGKGMENGAKLAITDVNASAAAKKVGLTFVAFSGDDQGDPKTGVNVANQFASDSKVIGVMGHLNSGVSIPASKVYNQANLVMVSPASTNPALTEQGLSNVFRVCTIDSVQGPSAADSAFKDLGKKIAFVVDDSTPYGVGLADEFGKQFEKDGGKLVGREKTGDKDTDFKALVTKIAAAKPDIVYYGGIYNSGALLSKQLKEGGVKVPLMGGDGLYDGQYIKLAGTAADGDYATSVGLPLDLLPKGQAFTTEFKKAYPGQEIAAYDAYSYDAATVIMNAAIEAAGTLGADKITTTAGKKAIIAAVAKTDFEGITGKISFDSKGDTTNKAITLYTVTAGAWVPYKK
jgi:branched-chain amino acid transport system substrate-binding protein